MTAAQRRVRGELVERGYRPLDVYKHTSIRGRCVEHWTSSGTDPDALLILFEEGGWELFVQPVATTDIATTWKAFDTVRNIQGVLGESS